MSVSGFVPGARGFARRGWLGWAALGVLAVLSWYALWGRQRGPRPLVVYCAHDAIYAEQILRQFEAQSGIPVVVRYDTEASKSLGLVELLEREKAAPRCDLFWNNELLGTLELARHGVLEPYMGPGFARIPARFKDPQGYWCGFAGRLRVIIFNTNAVAPKAGEEPAWPQDFSRRAIAKPLYGTTLTHYAALWQLWGAERLQAWHAQWRAAGGRELNGNAAVSNAVAKGVCDIGFTDTDDFFEAKDEGMPVAMRPVRLDNGQTICIPNTVALIHGSGRGAEARQLADFLLSEATELALARSKSRQIPLGVTQAGAAAELPAEVRELQGWAAEGVALMDLGGARAECLAWLKAEAQK